MRQCLTTKAEGTNSVWMMICGSGGACKAMTTQLSGSKATPPVGACTMDCELGSALCGTKG